MSKTNSKFFFDKMGDKIVTKFPDPVNLNVFFEIAQKMLDEGKDKKEIKKILKDLYSATKEELDRLEDKLFNKEKSKKQGSEEYSGSPLYKSLEMLLDEHDDIHTWISPDSYDKVEAQFGKVIEEMHKLIKMLYDEPSETKE